MAAQRKFVFALLACAGLLFATVGTVAAHHVTVPGCQQVVFASTTKGWEAVVEPGDLTFGPFLTNGDNGPYSIAAGSYTYQYYSPDGDGWKAQEHGTFNVAACATATPIVTPVITPVVTPPSDPTTTPFESFQGETATPATTPPPTSTDGGSSSNGATPILVMLIAIAFGGIGIGAVQAQRRSVRGR